jgi:hypothetical protein
MEAVAIDEMSIFRLFCVAERGPHRIFVWVLRVRPPTEPRGSKPPAKHRYLFGVEMLRGTARSRQAVDG